MKALFFDAGPVITLVMSRLSWILPHLKQKYGAPFYLTPAVKYELVDRPLSIKRFEFEALQVMKLIRDGVFEIYDKVPQQQVKSLQTLANSTFKIGRKSMDIIQSGEMESVASVLQNPGSSIVMDERTLRLLIESGKDLTSLLSRRFHKEVTSDMQKIKDFQLRTKGVSIIRSVELVGVAYKLGLLNGYIPKLRKGKEKLVDSVLWATKYNGCALTSHEIEELKKTLLT